MPITLAALAALDDGDFRALVDADVKNELPEPARSLLRDPALAERWYDRLVDAKKMTEASIKLKAAELLAVQEACAADGPAGAHRYRAERVAHERWRARARWALRCIEERLAEARVIRRAVRMARSAAADQAERYAYRGALEEIAAATTADAAGLRALAVAALARGRECAERAQRAGALLG